VNNEKNNKSVEMLIEMSKAGDQSAFESLFDMLSDRLFSYALAHTRNRDDSLDLVQDTFIDLWNGLSGFTYRNEESFYGFVFLVLKRKLYRHYKKQPRTVELDEKYIVDNYMLEVEDYRYLEKVIGTLPKNYQELLRLRYWSAFSFKEIAAVMDVKEGTAKVWHHRAVQALNARLNNKLLLD
jgi:RNA polymerase sigma-70 factor (ECF subfamily)